MRRVGFSIALVVGLIVATLPLGAGASTGPVYINELSVSTAGTDWEFVEVQGTAEETPFEESEFNALLSLAKKGIQELVSIQKEILGPLFP